MTRSRRLNKPATRYTPGPDRSWRAFTISQGYDLDPRLCHVLGEYRGMLRKAVGASSDDPNPGFPWLNLILGSGCLSGPTPSEQAKLYALPATMDDAIARIHELEDDPGVPTLLPDGLEEGELVRRFTQSILEARVSELADDRFTSAALTELFPSGEHARLVARCVLAGAQLNRMHHALLAVEGAVARPGSEIRLPADYQRSLEIPLESIAPAIRHLERLIEAARASEDEVLKSSKYVLEKARDGANELMTSPHRSSLTGDDIDALVEVAWLLLIQSVGMYPGWRDLMTAAALETSSAQSRKARPRFTQARGALDLQQAQASLRKATEISWGTATSEPTERHTFYQSAAGVLVAQSELEIPSNDLPLATAFVSSMDIELEMALLRKGKSFLVLLPYHLVYGDDDESKRRAIPVWLGMKVTPPKSLPKELDSLEGFTTEWLVASSEKLQRRAFPIVVVRLTGSPLMPEVKLDDPAINGATGHPFKDEPMSIRQQLTELAESLGESASGSLAEHWPHLDLEPALTLDEYSGLHQIAAATQGRLPRNVSDLDDHSTYLRFALAIGVQVDDPIVRLGLASHFDTATFDIKSQLDHHGVVVNRNFSASDADLLTWQGFDLVQSSFVDVSEDLRHYADHLHARVDGEPHPNIGSTFKLSGRCAVKDTVPDGE